MNSLDTSTLGWSPGLLGAYITQRRGFYQMWICFYDPNVPIYPRESFLTFLIASLTEFRLWGLSSTVSPTQAFISQSIPHGFPERRIIDCRKLQKNTVEINHWFICYFLPQTNMNLQRMWWLKWWKHLIFLCTNLCWTHIDNPASPRPTMLGYIINCKHYLLLDANIRTSVPSVRCMIYTTLSILSLQHFMFQLFSTNAKLSRDRMLCEQQILS